MQSNKNFFDREKSSGLRNCCLQRSCTAAGWTHIISLSFWLFSAVCLHFVNCKHLFLVNCIEWVDEYNEALSMKKRSGRPRNEHTGPRRRQLGIRYTIKSTIAKFLAISEFDYYVFHFYSSHDFWSSPTSSKFHSKTLGFFFLLQHKKKVSLEFMFFNIIKEEIWTQNWEGCNTKTHVLYSHFVYSLSKSHWF